MLAERLDFMVATYSSTRGTGARLIVWVLTGSGCGAGCFAWVSLHPELSRTAQANGINASLVRLSIPYYPQLSSKDARGATKDSVSRVETSDLGRPSGIRATSDAIYNVGVT